MKKVFFLALLAVLGFCRLSAQGNVGIGTASPNLNASLDLGAVNKGFLPNRVSLSGTTSPAPLNAHTAGMVVYNTAAAGTSPTNVVPGLYYNDGTQWIPLRPNLATGLHATCAGQHYFSNSYETIADWSVTRNDFGSAWNAGILTVPAGMQGWYSITAAFQADEYQPLGPWWTPFNHVLIQVNGTYVAGGDGTVRVNGGTTGSPARPPSAGTASAAVSYYLNTGDQVRILASHLTSDDTGVYSSMKCDKTRTYVSILKQ